VALLAVAEPPTSSTSVVVRAVNVPFDAVLHFKSAAGLVVRAGAPGEVLVAVQSAAAARTSSVHAAFALTVSDGPVVEFNPASKSEGVGAVSVVDPALICTLTTRPAVIETLPGRLQLAGAPLAVHCAAAIDGRANAATAIATSAAQSRMRLIGAPALL
jgi:hypothetical protein